MKPIFAGLVKNGETLYVPIPIRAHTIGAHIAWKDATSSATITLELSSLDHVSPTTTGAAWEWCDGELTIAGPAATAAGSTIINVCNVRQRAARLKIVAAADSTIDIWDGTS